MNRHPSEAELALLAGNDCGRVSRFFLNRHIGRCAACMDIVAEFAALREDAHADESDLANLNWDSLAAEMRANIHLGLEAGECVKAIEKRPVALNPRLAVAFASLMVLAGAGFLMRPEHAAAPLTKQASPVLESAGGELELRSGDASLTLSSRHGTVANKTVNAQGVIRASYVEAGAVTINDVFLQ